MTHRLLLAPLALLAVPAVAQDSDTKVAQVYITEDEECPASTADTIVVCGVLEDPYRIPPALRDEPDGDNVSWAARVSRLETVGAAGTMSCSPTGTGGITGCTQKMIEAAYRDRAEADSIRFGQLIEEQRAERLSTIDAEAAETQARVEELERRYLERLEAERGAPIGEEVVDPDAPPALGDRTIPAPPEGPELELPFDGDGEEPQPIDSQAPARIGIDG